MHAGRLSLYFATSARTVSRQSSPPASKGNVIWNGYPHTFLHLIRQFVHIHIHVVTTSNITRIPIILIIITILAIPSFHGIVSNILIVKKCTLVTPPTTFFRMKKTAWDIFISFSSSLLSLFVSLIAIHFHHFYLLLWRTRCHCRAIPYLFLNAVAGSSTTIPLFLLGPTVKSKPFGVHMYTLQMLESIWFSCKLSIAALNQATVRCFAMLQKCLEVGIMTFLQVLIEIRRWEKMLDSVSVH